VRRSLGRVAARRALQICHILTIEGREFSQCLPASAAWQEGKVYSAVYQFMIDRFEFVCANLFGMDDVLDEKDAEKYADLASGLAVDTLSRCLGREVSFFKLRAYDDDAWDKCRTVPGNMWRFLFCEEWS